MPTKIRATSKGPYEVANAQPTPAAIPIILTKMYIHLRPYTLAIGDQNRGAIPAKTMARVVVYDVVVIDRSRYSESGRKPAFCGKSVSSPTQIQWICYPTIAPCENGPRKARKETCSSTSSLNHLLQLSGSDLVSIKVVYAAETLTPWGSLDGCGFKG